jgi:frataxin-like iron-binding protein CyaY
MTVKRLKNEKTFPFRSYEGKEPTNEQLREEAEELYKYLVGQLDEVLESIRIAGDVHDEVLTLDGEPVLLNNDIVMVVGIPNNNSEVWQQQLN